MLGKERSRDLLHGPINSQTKDTGCIRNPQSILRLKGQAELDSSTSSLHSKVPLKRSGDEEERRAFAQVCLVGKKQLS